MRTRKELVYLNVRDLTPEELEKLSDYELNCCDKCGEIEISELLIWLENCYIDGGAVMTPVKILLGKGYVAVCNDCMAKEEKKYRKENK